MQVNKIPPWILWVMAYCLKATEVVTAAPLCVGILFGMLAEGLGMISRHYSTWTPWFTHG